MTSELTARQSHLLIAGLERVEALKAEKAAIIAQLNEEIEGWYTDLQTMFGTSAVYERPDGSKIKWRLATTKSTSHKKVLDEVRESATPSLAKFIDTRREELSKTGKRKSLTATKPKRGRKPVADPALVRRVRQSYSRGGNVSATASKYGLSVPTTRNIVEREGAYAKI